MNTPSPLVPQGSLLQSKGKSTVRIAFFTIAAIHVVFIGGLLMQGCKKSEDKPVAVEETNLPPLDPMPPDYTATNYDPNLAAPTLTNLPSQLPPPNIDVNVLRAEVPEELKEYVVVKGDSFSSIALKTGVSLKAIEQANPGVDSTKLQIGQKLKIPAASSVPSTTSAAPSNGDATVYVVKSGDMLEKIAKRNGTTVKAIMDLNNLKTTTIKVGQKLKLPASQTAEPTAAPVYVTPLPDTKTNP
jgi:LysM repeat protein